MIFIFECSYFFKRWFCFRFPLLHVSCRILQCAVVCRCVSVAFKQLDLLHIRATRKFIFNKSEKNMLMVLWFLQEYKQRIFSLLLFLVWQLELNNIILPLDLFFIQFSVHLRCYFFFLIYEENWRIASKNLPKKCFSFISHANANIYFWIDSNDLMKTVNDVRKRKFEHFQKYLNIHWRAESP